MMRIYFAGKIDRNDWRHELFTNSRLGAVEDIDQDLFNPDYVQEKLWRRFKKYQYGGPFFISDDHGCAHGPESHGANASSQGSCCIDAMMSGTITKEKIFAINNERIRQATHIFCPLNSHDAFGTLVELGYAFALKKPIALSIHGDVDHAAMWYAKQTAKVIYHGNSVVRNFNSFMRDYEHV